MSVLETTQNLNRVVMNRIARSILFLASLILLGNCKKSTSNPTKSNSTYNKAVLFIEREKWVFRSDSFGDSVSQSIMIGAKFGDSAQIYAFTDTVGNVSVSGLGLGRPNFWNNAPTPYYFQLNNAGASALTRFDNVTWVVTAPNGIEDISHDAGSTAYYQDVIPKTIVRSNGLLIRTNSMVAPNADSVNIHIGVIDTTVSNLVDSIWLSPAKLSVLPVITDRSYFIVLRSLKDEYVTVNGKGFSISNTRTLRYDININ